MDGESPISFDVTLQQLARLTANVPDGRITTGDLRQLADPREISPQGVRLASQAGGLQAAVESAETTNSLLRVAANGFDRIGGLLDQLRDLAVEAARADASDVERAFLDQAFQDTLDEVDRIANETNFQGRNLIDAEVLRLIPLGQTQFPGVTTINGGTATFTINPALTGQGIRNIRFTGFELAPGMTVTNNGATFPDIRRFTLVVLASPPRILLGGVTALTENGMATTVNFAQADPIPALNVMMTGTDFRITATQITTLTLSGVPDVGTAMVSLSAGFSLQIMGPVAFATGEPALAGEEDTELGLRVGTGTIPAEDEIMVTIGGLTPGALALQDVNLQNEREADRAVRLVDEAIISLETARASVAGDGEAALAALNSIQDQRDGTISARNLIGEPPDPDLALSLSQRTAQDLLNQLDFDVALLGSRLPQDLFRFFP